MADHAPAPRKRRRLAPSTMRRPPARNRRKPHSGARRRMVEAEMPETCAACCKVKEIAPGFGAGRFLESLGIVCHLLKSRGAICAVVALPITIFFAPKTWDNSRFIAAISPPLFSGVSGAPSVLPDRRENARQSQRRLVRASPAPARETRQGQSARRGHWLVRRVPCP